jgi:hypothetical protein
MVSAFLIVVGVVVAALLLIAVLMVYTYFGHEDDKDEAILPKVVVVCARVCHWHLCHPWIFLVFSVCLFRLEFVGPHQLSFQALDFLDSFAFLH